MDPDSFDDVLNLEDQYYKEGYQQGYDDGVEAGKIEGRSVGLKKGFEKFLEAGRMQGKSIVWANRLPTEVSASTNTQESQQPEHNENEEVKSVTQLPPLEAGNPRLAKNITMLYALVEPGTLSTENTDEAVNDFDDRFKRAQGKLKIVERALGEGAERQEASEVGQSTAKNENIEDGVRIQKRSAEPGISS